MKEDFNDTTVRLYYSEKAANLFGYISAVVYDEGETNPRTVFYTMMWDKKNPENYKWDDKEVIWEGPKRLCFFQGNVNSLSFPAVRPRRRPRVPNIL